MEKPLLYNIYCGAGGCSRGYQQAGFRVIGVDKYPQPHYIGDGSLQMDALEFLRRYLAGEFERAAAIHTSPPCQGSSALRNLHKHKTYEDMIPDTRSLLQQIGLPYVIENVVGAVLNDPVMLCGTMFGLRTECGAELRRHRLFETNWDVGLLPNCQHYAKSPLGVHGDHPRDSAAEREKYPRADKRSIDPNGTGQPTAGKRSTISVHGHSGGSSPLLKNRTILITGSTPQQNVVRNTIRECFPVSAARTAMGIDWMPMKSLSQAIPPSYCKFIGERLIEYLNWKEDQI